MANAREIQARMNSIRDTMKITNAMYLVSSTKLRKARKSLQDTEPYFITLEDMIGRIVTHMPEIENRYFDDSSEWNQSEKKQAYIVITADKGLAGAYNHNVLKLAQQLLENSKNWQLFVVGEVGRQYFTSRGIPIEENFLYTAQNPSLHRARSITGVVMEKYMNREVDEIVLIFTRMKNSLVAEACKVRLLPLNKADYEGRGDTSGSEPVFHPSVEAALDNIVPDFVTGYVYGALVESFCSEQNARMMAMDSANENAKDMIHTLSIDYNRVRQGAITQEITEVIGGAKALKKKKESGREGQK